MGKASILWKEMSEADREPWLQKFEEDCAAYEKFEEEEEESLALQEAPSGVKPNAQVPSGAKPNVKVLLAVQKNSSSGPPTLGASGPSTPATKRPQCSDSVGLPSTPARKKPRMPTKANRATFNWNSVTYRQGFSGWQRFSPKFVDPKLCMSRTWADGYGGQCTKGCLGDSQLCRLHSKEQADDGLVHGRVDGEIPEPKMKEFMKIAASRS